MQLASSDIFCLRHPDHPLTQELRNIVSQIDQESEKPQPSVASKGSKFKWPGR